MRAQIAELDRTVSADKETIQARLSDLADHFLYVLLDALKERLQLCATVLDALEISLPLTSHGGALHLGMNDLDQSDPFLRCF